MPIESFRIQNIYLWDMMRAPVDVIFYLWYDWNILRNGSRKAAYESNDLYAITIFKEFAEDFNFT